MLEKDDNFEYIFSLKTKTDLAFIDPDSPEAFTGPFFALVYFHKINIAKSAPHAAALMETSDVTRKPLVENDRAVTMTIARDPNNACSGVMCKRTFLV